MSAVASERRLSMEHGADRTLDPALTFAAAEAAGRLIPPAWPLEATVAVNPFLGQTQDSLALVDARLARTCTAAATMPREWYLTQIAAGLIRDEDLADALSSSRHALPLPDVAALKAAAMEKMPERCPLPTVADLARDASGIDWPGIVSDRIAAWAGGYFDAGQALWPAAKGTSAFAAWRSYATHDLTPELLGLRGFANAVDAMPVTAREAISVLADRLRLSHHALESYFHQLHLSLSGWSQFARYKLWQAELNGSSDGTLSDLLAVRLVWEAALFDLYSEKISDKWRAAVEAHGAPLEPTPAIILNTILQDAYDRAAQRDIARQLTESSPERGDMRPRLQAVFCIDVRSEVFRRALEAVHPNVQTIGFAGFFGMAVAHQRSASDLEEARLPVLLKPTQFTCSLAPGVPDKDQALRFKLRAKRAWGRFKLAAVSSFAFVEAAGPMYGGKLLIDGLGLAGTPTGNDPTPRRRRDIDRSARAKTASDVLKAMSLTEGFAPLVLLVGHGANVANNPHASALHCGACGGYTGDVNARLLAALLNDTETRQDLATLGIDIPKDTLFLAALHDTTTDRITLYTEDQGTSAHQAEIDDAQAKLAAAGAVARAERALRWPGSSKASSADRRSGNWAEVRPEWGLAGCRSFIAAPRSRTAGKSFGGRAFLHDYDWRRDAQFGVLELILTAPVVVASWISLQYYGSTVAPQMYGAGNKLLHNVVGGIGVLEGNGGPLRAGLPWQSIHDGTRLVHDPLRLCVCIEAPREAIADVLSRHPGVRSLFDNQWLFLMALDESGRLAWRYQSGGNWTEFNLH